MERRPPRQPRVAWEEVLAPQESSSAAEPPEVTVVQPLQPNASWVPVYAQGAMDFIQAFVSSPEQLQDNDLKLKFLESICTLCRDVKESGFSQDLNDFCSRCKLGQMIQVLLKLEPKYEICTQVRQLAMLALAGLSTIGTVLEKKRKLLRVCFDSIFFLPPKREMQRLEATLFSSTLRSMDAVLEVMVLSSPASKIIWILQHILEELLDYIDRVAVQERAMGRVRQLSKLLAHSSSRVLAGQNEDSAAACGEIQIPVLGKLLGHLLFKSFRTEKTSSMALDSLCSLFTFICHQKDATLPEGHARSPAHWKSEIISLLNTPSIWTVKAFGRYLRPAERTGVVLAAIEILGRSSLLDKKAPTEFLEVAMKSPKLWLMDVPKIVRHIFAYCDEKNTTTAHSFYSLLALMANKWPGRVVATALDIAPRISDKVCLWKAMFSVRQTLEKVLKELQIQLQRWHNDIFTEKQKSCLTFLAMLASDNVDEDDLDPFYRDLRSLRQEK